MIFFLFSLFIYDAEVQTFASSYLFANDLNFTVKNRGKWLFSEAEGGLCFDCTSHGIDFGFSDIFIRAGVNRYVRIFDVSLYPTLHLPGSREEGELRSFSVKNAGVGYGMGFGTRILWFAIGMDFEFIEYFSDPATDHFMFNSRIKFNPDTLTFALDFGSERFSMNGQTPISSIYIKPNIILSRWDKFALNFGFAFRISERVDRILLNNTGLTEIGIGTSYYDFPLWKICFGISSLTLPKESGKLFDLRILLIDEEGDPASGVLSLADSGSFQVEKGEIRFSLPSGIYPMSVYAENYLPLDTVFVLKGNKDALLQLREEPDFNVVEGKIVDVETGEPLYADILVENSINSEAKSDPKNGTYKIYLTSGDYIIRVASKGYYPCASLIEVEPGKSLKLDFELLPIKKGG